MSVVSTVDIYVSHVEGDGPLLKLWVQLDRRSVVLIEQCILNLIPHFEVGKGLPHYPALTTGKICCAKYSDGQYYRAKIVNLSLIAQGKVTLHFVDYGNTETVNASEIRLLDVFGSHPLNGFREQAEDFYLAGVVPSAGVWEDDVLKYIKKKICYADIKGSIVARFGARKMLKIIVQNEDFSNFLISQEICHPVMLQAQQSLAAQRHQVPMFAGFTVPPPVVQQNVYSVPPSKMAPPAISRLPPPQPPLPPVQQKTTSLIFTSPLLEINSQHEVYVSFVEDGPISFSIQLKENEQLLAKLMDKIKSFPHVTVSGPLMPGSVCLGRYSSDKMLCRAVVTNVQADSCKVYYVDFGNSEVLPYSEIFSLPNELVEPKVMALRFTLYAVKDLGEISDDVKEVFSELVCNKLLVMRVTPSDGPPLKQYCELFDDGNNIKELIAAKMKVRRKVESYRSAPLPKVGLCASVVVSYVEMPSLFYLQYERTSAQLAILMTAVQDHCVSAAPVSQARLRVGLPCCAPYSEDGQWYRAQILSLSPTEVTVLYVDFGNTEDVGAEQLREISAPLAEALEPQAVFCCLKGFQGGILSDLTNTFEQLVLDKVLQMMVVQMVNDVAVVELYDKELDIGAHLLSPPKAPTNLQLDIPPTGDNGWSASEGVLALATSEQEHQDRPWSGKESSNQRPPRFQRQQQQRNNWTQDHRGPRKPWFENLEQESWKKKEDSNKSWQKRERDGDEKPWQKRERDGDEKPWQKQERDGEEKPWQKQKRDRDWEDKPSWQRRDRDGEDKSSWQRRDRDGEDKPSWQRRDRDGEDKPSWQRRDRDGEDKPSWQKRDRDGEDKPSWQKRDRDGEGKSSWQKKRDREEEDKPSWQKRDRDGEDKPSWQKRDRDGEDKTSWQKRDRDGEDKPSWQKRDRDSEGKPSWQRKDRDGEEKPSWQRKDRDGEDKPWQRRNQYDEKPWHKRDDDRKWGNQHDEDGNEKGRGNWGDKKKQWGQDDGNRFGKKGYSDFDSDKRYGKSSGGQNTRGNKSNNNDFSVVAATAQEEEWGDNLAIPASVVSPPVTSVLYGCLTPPTVISGETKTVELVYIASPDDFVVQVIADSKPLAELMTHLVEVYGGGEGTPVSAPQAGTTCIAKYSEDQQWYRAVVQSIAETSAHIFFPDYGNQEDVPISELVDMAEEFQKLPVQGVRCSLSGAKPQGPAWTDDDINNFTAATECKQLEATFVQEMGGIFEVVLKDLSTGQVINEMYGSATVATVMPIQASAPVEYAGLMDDFPLVEVALGTATDIVITWFINPEEFYCQLVSSETEFKAMMKELQVAYSSRGSRSVPIEVGLPAVVQFKTDGVLYRARVETESWGNCVVEYVDYGNREQVTSEEVQGLERKFLTPPRQALLCSLRGVRPQDGLTWPVGQSTLDQCFDAVTLLCTFHELTENGTYLVSLKRGDQDVAEELVEKGFAEPVTVTPSAAAAAPAELETVDPQLLVGMTLRASVCFVESCHNFFVHLDTPSVDYIQSLTWEIIENLQGTEAVLEDNMTPGVMCVATPDSETWYRGQIIAFPDAEGVLVRFVDYGDQHVIPKDKVLVCPASLGELPYQAVACCLHTESEMTPELEEQFKTNLETQDVILRVESCSENRISVLVFDVDGKVHDFLEGVFDGTSEVQPLCPFLVTTKTRVWVSHVTGGESIWLQRTRHEESLTALVEQLFTFYETEAKGLDLEATPGMLCAAKSPTDGNWYRASLVSVGVDSVNVLFLDYGNGEEVPLTSVKALNEIFYIPNILATSIMLPVVQVVGEDNLVEKVTELTSGEEFVAEFSRDGDRLVADLVKDSTSISKQLSGLGVASLLPGYLYTVEKETAVITTEDECVAFVSFIESPVEFWVQVASNATDIENLQSDLQCAADGLQVIEAMPALNELLAVMFSDDGNWYRAKVMQIEETQITVCFVDYGNVEVVDYTASQLKHLPEDMKVKPPFAARCKFDLIPVSGSEWSTGALERFENLVAETGGPFVIKTLYEDEVKHVEMFVEGMSISEVLVNEGLAVSCAQANAIPERPTPFGSNREQVFISHGTSPSRFCVQREVDSMKIDNMMARLAEAEHYPAVEEPVEANQLVAAQHEDGLWYRASVIAAGDETTVLFVDYGKEGCSSDLRLLPLDLSAVSPLGKICSLKIPASLNEWPTTLDAEFEALAAEGTTCFEMEVVQEGDPAIVILYLDGKSVVEILQPLCEPDVIQMTTLPLSESNPDTHLDKDGVCVSYRTSPSEFWVQNVNSIELLEKLSEWLADAEGFPNIYDITEGLLCAAKFEEDSMWYRARVQGTSDEGTLVLFVDYGNTAVCRDLRALSAKLEQLPPLAHRCQLLLLPGASGWSQLACETFLDSTADNTKVFQAEVVEDDDPVIVTLSHNGKDIFHAIAVDSLIIPDMGSDDDILELEAIKIKLPSMCDVAAEVDADAKLTRIDDDLQETAEADAVQVTAVLTVSDSDDDDDDDATHGSDNEVNANTSASSEVNAVVGTVISAIVDDVMDNSEQSSFKEVNEEYQVTVLDNAKEDLCKNISSDMSANFTKPVADLDGTSTLELEVNVTGTLSTITDVNGFTLESGVVDVNATNLKVLKHDSETGDGLGVGAPNFRILKTDSCSETVSELSLTKLKPRTESVAVDEKAVKLETDKIDVEVSKFDLENIDVHASNVEREETDIYELETDDDINVNKLQELRLNVDMSESEVEVVDVNKIHLETSEAAGCIFDLETDVAKINTGKLDVLEADENLSKSHTSEASEIASKLSGDTSVNPDEGNNMAAFDGHEAVSKAQQGSVNNNEVTCLKPEERVSECVVLSHGLEDMNGITPKHQDTSSAFTGQVHTEQTTLKDTDLKVKEQYKEAQEEEDSGEKRAPSPVRPTEHVEWLIRDIPVEMKTLPGANPSHLPRATVELNRVSSCPDSPRCDNTEHILPGSVSGNCENGS